MTIQVKLSASETSRSLTFSLDDLCISQQEWDEMTDEQKESTLSAAVYDLPEHPYWCVDSFTEKQ